MFIDLGDFWSIQYRLPQCLYIIIWLLRSNGLSCTLRDGYDAGSWSFEKSVLESRADVKPIWAVKSNADIGRAFRFGALSPSVLINYRSRNTEGFFNGMPRIFGS